MLLGILFGTMIIFIFLGMDIGLAMAAAGVCYIIASHFFSFNPLAMVIVPQNMWDGLNSFTMLAIPLFLLAGEIMNRGGITIRLIAFCNMLVGHLRGGLAHVGVLVNIIMSGISGSAIADCAATGKVLIPSMEKEGYDKAYACAVIASAGTIGPIIPPSIPFVILGSIVSVSIGRLFIGGIVPGLLMGFSLMVAIYFQNLKSTVAIRKRASIKDMFSTGKDALLALMMPIVILGSIITGIADATEAAGVGVVYAILLSSLIYKKLHLKDYIEILGDVGVLSGAIMITISTAHLIGFFTAIEEMSKIVSQYILSVTANANIIFAIINIVLLILGSVMEPIPVILILAPTLFKIAADVNINHVHLGVVMVVNLMIGLMTPPIGLNIFVTSIIGNVSILTIAKRTIPFLLILIVALAVITYVPSLVTYLPDLLMP